jgi:hypothetical protein
MLEAIAAVLAEHADGLRMRDIAAAVADRVGEPVPLSSSSPVSRARPLADQERLSDLTEGVIASDPELRSAET